MSKSILSQKTLKKYLKYDPETGLFTWLVKRNSFRSKVKPGAVAGNPQVAGYIELGLLGKRYLVHRLAFLYMDGKMPPNEVDHINHDRADNRWINLRHATRIENGRNIRMRDSNTSGITGVYWSKVKRKWVAQIMVNHKIHVLGYSADIQKVAVLRKAAEAKYGFHENHGK